MLFLIILVAGLSKIGRVAWHEYINFHEAQETHTAVIAERAHLWQENMIKKQDERWQGFIEKSASQQQVEQRENRASIQAMAHAIHEVTDAVKHLTHTTTQINETLVSHIIEDDARFAILLPSKPITTPRKKKGTEDGLPSE